MGDAQRLDTIDGVITVESIKTIVPHKTQNLPINNIPIMILYTNSPIKPHLLKFTYY